MINFKTLPTVLLETAPGNFKSVSVASAKYGRDSYLAPLADDAPLYFGLYKKFSALYLELKTPSTEMGLLLAVEYWNGAGWIPLIYAVDETDCLTRSGFIQWDTPAAWDKKVVDGVEKYWVRLVPSQAISTDTQIQGLNILFSDDHDLQAVYPAIMNFMEDAIEQSYVLRHETARDDIIQWIRNSGETKKSKQLGVHAQIEAWDILAIEEVRNWSKYLVLANIFSGLQSKEDSVWKQKLDEYTEKAEMARAAFYLTLDKDDDGVVSPVEAARDISVRKITRS